MTYFFFADSYQGVVSCTLSVEACQFPSSQTRVRRDPTDRGQRRGCRPRRNFLNYDKTKKKIIKEFLIIKLNIYKN
jgi:hypothetical protein